MRYLGILTEDMIGKRLIRLSGKYIYLNNCIGYVQHQDVGKRVYENDGVIQVENDEQINERLKNG